MNDKNKALFLAHARRESPREACAILITESEIETLVICRNIATEKDQFIIHHEDYATAEDRGEVLAIIHSHPNESPHPSEADRVSCSNLAIKWYIVGTITGEWFELFPDSYKAPLIGRNWCHGVLDCFSIVRDYYKEKLNIEIPDFQRTNEWWLKNENLYQDNFSKAGFIQVPFDSLQEHDVILMRLKSKVPNHGAVYLGEGIMLHHTYKKLSGRAVYGGYWQKNTAMIVRHRDLIDAKDNALRGIGDAISE
jgi:proteasome lid subunit RPN8/RPN11